MFQRIGYFARETLVSLRRNLLMTLAGIITITVSLSVFGAALLVGRLVDNGTQKWKEGVRFEIFLNVDATQEQVEALSQELSDSPDVKSFRYLTKEDAYEEFKRLFADEPDLVNSIDPSVLPASFRVAPTDAGLTDTLVERFETRPGVDEVETAEKVLKGILSFSSWIRGAFFVTAILLVAASLFLIVNTIRLATFARRREIEVMKLVGASNWFVRLPFMAEGLVQGLIGAGLSVGVVFGLRKVLSNALERGSGDFIRSFYVTTGDARTVALVVLVVGAVVGVFASWVGLRRFLDV